MILLIEYESLAMKLFISYNVKINLSVLFNMLKDICSMILFYCILFFYIILSLQLKRLFQLLIC
jgi:hypothetical protein